MPPSPELSSPESCPVDYRYGVEALNEPLKFEAETIYVVGGLYGNPEALEAVLAMKMREERTGPPVTLVFNGDFHWFDVDEESYRAVSATVLEHHAIAGNVEAELSRRGQDTNCGCNYPSYVDPGMIERSNRIFSRLKETAAQFPRIQQDLRSLPMHLAVGVGPAKIGILHGDPESLAGWSLAAEALPGPQGDSPDVPAVQQTDPARIEGYFRESGLTAFATSHTCLAFAQDVVVDGETRVVINNGSAGMPNFRGVAGGVLTRISSHPEVPPESLYGSRSGGVRYDALPISYQREKWLRRFLDNWPEGSPAHRSYFERLSHGPAHGLNQAVRGRFREGRFLRSA